MSDSYYATKGTLAAEQQRILPEFMVKKLEGTVKHTVYDYEQVEKRDNKGQIKYVNRRVERVVEEDAGFMVYLPKKGSFRVRSEAELHTLGLHRRPGLVDMETGDLISNTQMVDLSQLEEAEQMAKTVNKRGGK